MNKNENFEQIKSAKLKYMILKFTNTRVFTDERALRDDFESVTSIVELLGGSTLPATFNLAEQSMEAIIVHNDFDLSWILFQLTLHPWSKYTTVSQPYTT
jgi:hypothetical protein